MTTKIHAVVITVSDACARGERHDESGAELVRLLSDVGAEIVETKILSDDLEPLVKNLRLYAERRDVNLIITTGGTGLSPRDNTPEATRRVIDSEVPGIAEAIRSESMRQTPMAMISRGVAGISFGSLIINLPGSPQGARQGFAVIKPVLNHAADLLAGITAH